VVLNTSKATGYVPVTYSVADYAPTLEYWEENPLAKSPTTS
jgi:hypothetical protein